ncbi:MAG TPA: helix-turn-helix domain-containing protein [Syntrophales bacterium]|nr:helix-turn-helix domain-containing protein [Syntrophales bacterium]
MGKSKLTITHPDITHDSLDEYLSRRCPERIGLRIAILQGVMDQVPIDHLSCRRKMSRQGIYNLVNRINKNGMKGLEDKHPGRPCKLTAKIAADLKEVLMQSPMSIGYRQFHWDNNLVRQYLREKHGVYIGRSQLMNWLRAIRSPVKLARKKNRTDDLFRQTVFINASKKMRNQRPDEIITFPDDAGFQLDPVLVAQWMPEGCKPQLLTEGIQ